jgi:hypothetical protein
MRHEKTSMTSGCEAPGCGRTGVCLALVDRRENLVTDELTNAWSPCGLFNWGPAGIVFRPHKMSVSAALRRLRSATHEPWQTVCARCLGVRFIEHASHVEDPQQPDPWVFTTEARSKLIAFAKRKRRVAALDRLLPRLESEILDGLNAQWALPQGLR